jgi:hypothetical protein
MLCAVACSFNKDARCPLAGEDDLYTSLGKFYLWLLTLIYGPVIVVTIGPGRFKPSKKSRAFEKSLPPSRQLYNFVRGVLYKQGIDQNKDLPNFDPKSTAELNELVTKLLQQTGLAKWPTHKADINGWPIYVIGSNGRRYFTKMEADGKICRIRDVRYKPEDFVEDGSTVWSPAPTDWAAPFEPASELEKRLAEDAALFQRAPFTDYSSSSDSGSSDSESEGEGSG